VEFSELVTLASLIVFHYDSMSIGLKVLIEKQAKKQSYLLILCVLLADLQLWSLI
jgi:hypothetical protein